MVLMETQKITLFRGYRPTLSTAGNGFYLLSVLFHKQSQQESSKSQNCYMLLLASTSSNLSDSSRFILCNYMLLNISQII
jgi:hypothetical protein